MKIKVWKPREATLLQSNKIYSSIMGEIMEDMDESSRTKLDSHANIPVIRKNAYILSKIGETVDVAPFTPDYNPIRVELVDTDMIYIKTQVFRLLRHYSPAPRNIARSNLVTQNITHNMTSSIVQPNGLHSL